MKRALRVVRTAAITSALAACGAPSPDVAAPQAEPAPVPAPVLVPTEAPTAELPVLSADATPTAAEGAQGAGAAAAAASRFAAWGAVHALIGSPVKLGVMVSSREAMALTSDNLVGVTTNGGQSWGFTRHDNGVVLAIAGKASGPFFAVGKAGYASISLDGKTWSDLPRHTNQDLTSVAVDSSGAVALAKSGDAFVHYGADGKSGRLALFPDKFKARAVRATAGAYYAEGGKLPLVSRDARSWSVADAPLPKPTKSFLTRQGVCGTGRVEKATGVVCEVKGQAFGTSSGTVVAQKGAFFTTTSGGSSWSASAAPMTAANGVVSASGNLVAFGNGGAIALSADGGKRWTDASLEVKKSLRAALVDGSTVLLAGDGGIVARSTNGGASFTVIETPQKGAIKQLAKLADGRIVASLGARGVESTDGGATWADMLDPTPLAELVPPAKPGKCEGRMPAVGEVCAVQKQVTSPVGLPNVKGIVYDGDNGLAWGDYGLVMTTTNGGASWTSQSGFAVKSFDTFEVRGQLVLGVGAKDVLLSQDGGRSFTRHLLPKQAGRVFAAHISKDGKVLYALGGGGMIARAFVSAPDAWELLDVGNVAAGGKKVTANFVAIHELGATPEAGGLLFAVGARGELYRSENRGDGWWPIATGTTQVIQAMAADGETIVAVTHADRKGGNLLLRSDNGGRHFFIAREVSHAGQVDLLTLSAGVLTYRNRVSTDFGATWSQPDDSKYWGGAKEAGDGLRIVNHPSRYTRDTIYLVGQDKNDWVIMDGIQTKGARFECADSGCWMLHGGQIFRPL